MNSGYASFGYLDDEPTAFTRFPLAPESGRVPAYDGGFDAATVARAEQLLARSIVVSLHDHPVRFPADMALTPQYNRTGRQHTAFAGLASSGLTAVFDNMMDGTAYVTLAWRSTCRTPPTARESRRCRHLAGRCS